MNKYYLLMSQILKQYNNNLDIKYYKTLKKILHKQHNKNYDSYFDSLLSEEAITESEVMNESISISDIKTNDDNPEDFYYKKPWNKLNIIHKKIKIKEFINNLLLTKQKKKTLIDKLIHLLNEKKLNKKNEIDYDSNNGKIITITILKCKNDEYFI